MTQSFFCLYTRPKTAHAQKQEKPYSLHQNSFAHRRVSLAVVCCAVIIAVISRISLTWTQSWMSLARSWSDQHSGLSRECLNHDHVAVGMSWGGRPKSAGAGGFILKSSIVMSSTYCSNFVTWDMRVLVTASLRQYHIPCKGPNDCLGAALGICNRIWRYITL